MKQHQINGGFLRVALLSNAGFSFLCAVLAVFNSTAGGTLLFAEDMLWPAIPAGTALFALGIGLFIFSALVGATALPRLISKRAVLAITIADAMWVIASIALLVLAAGLFTDAGKWIVVVVASAVFLFGVGQAIGLAMLYQGESKISISRTHRTRHVSVSRHVNASAATAWQIMIDHEAYADIAENLSGVEVIQGDSEGMQRKCTDTDGNTWLETAHVWEEGKRYGFTIDTAAPDYPYPLETLQAVWSVEASGPDACMVAIAFDVTPLRSLKGSLFISVSMVMFPKVLHRLLGKWKDKMERQANT